MIRLDIASGAQHHFTNDNFHQRAAHRRKALEPHWPTSVCRPVPDRSPRCQRLTSPTKQLRRSHSGAPGNRRNIGAGNKRFLHKPGLRLGGPAAPSPKRPCLQVLDHLTISIITHRRTYRNFHHNISDFINAEDSQISINRAMCGHLDAYHRSRCPGISSWPSSRRGLRLGPTLEATI